MVEKIKNNRFVILLLLIGAVYFFLQKIVPLTAPILVAMLFVTIFGSLLQKMQSKWKIHRQVGAILILILACTIVGLLVWVLFSWIVGSLPGWTGELDSLESGIGGVVHEICNLVGKIPGVDSAYFEEMILLNIQDGFDYFQEHLLPGMLSQSLEYLKMVLAVGGFLLTFVITTVLLAKDYDEIMNRLLDREECHVFLEVICGIIRYLATFVKAQAIIMSIIGVSSAVILGIIGIPHGIFWGLLAGILDAFPFIGTGIVLIPIAVQQVFGGNYLRAVLCLLLYVGCILVREVLEPKLIGKRVGVSPVAILASIYAGIRLFGVWGIIGGPLGFVIVQQAYLSLARRWDSQQENLHKECGDLPGEDGEEVELHVSK